MNLDHVEFHASPYFMNASCPKHKDSMIELDNGWFSVCWYCEKCKFPYQLQMRKMLKVNKENLKQALEKHYAKSES